MVASKWDIAKVGIEDLRPRLQDRPKQRPPLVAVSAKTGRGMGRLLDRIEELCDKHTSRVTTGELNRLLQDREARQPPSKNGKRLNLLYGTQTQVRPPRFRFFVNDPGLHDDYGYWVENQLRERFELEGVPSRRLRRPSMRRAVRARSMKAVFVSPSSRCIGGPNVKSLSWDVG